MTEVATPCRQQERYERLTKALSPTATGMGSRVPMCACKHLLTTKLLLFLFIALLFSPHAKAQVVVDVSKITCDQFASYKIENPKYIAIWIDGYYHGTRGDMKVDIQTLSVDARKVEVYCLSKPDVPLVQAVKTVLGISVGP